MSILTKPLLALSKTDRNLIALCSDHAYKTQAGYGVFVLIVGIFAFCSSSYALSTSLGLRAVYFVAAVYATLIMLIDREIVSGTSKNRVMIGARLVLAVFIGLVVSVPLELRIFQQQITQQLKQKQNDNNKPYMEEKQHAENQFRARVATAEQGIQQFETEASELEHRVTNELMKPYEQFKGVVAGTGKPGRGPVYRRLQEQVGEKNKQLERARNALQDLRNEQQRELTRIDDQYHQQEIPPADDLLSRYVALGAVKQDPKQGSDAWAMAWGVRLLLILLELTPALIKLLQEENEYEALLRANRRRSITRIYSIANDHMEQLVQNGGQNPTPTLIGQLKSEPLTL